MALGAPKNPRRDNDGLGRANSALVETQAPTQDAVEPASPGRQHRPLGGDAKGGAGGLYFNQPRLRK